MNRQVPKVGKGWKWAFIALLLVNIVFFGYLYNILFSADLEGTGSYNPEESGQSATENQAKSIDAIITLNNNELEMLMQGALQKGAEATNIPGISITEVFTLKGELEFLGLPLNYQLVAEPFAVDNGDLQLKVQKVSLGAISLPISQALGILQGNFQTDLPMLVDTENQLIYLLLSEIETVHFDAIKLEKIEKESLEYTFNITIPSENLLQ